MEPSFCDDAFRLYLPDIIKAKQSSKSGKAKTAKKQRIEETRSEIFAKASPLSSADLDINLIVPESPWSLLEQANREQYDVENGALIAAIFQHIAKVYRESSEPFTDIPAIKSESLRFPIHFIRTVSTSTADILLEQLRNDEFPDEITIAPVALDGSKIERVSDFKDAVLTSENQFSRGNGDMELSLDDLLTNMHHKALSQLRDDPEDHSPEELEQVPSALVFIVDKAESIPSAVLAEVVKLLYRHGVVAVFVLLYQFIVSPNIALQDCAPYISLQNVQSKNRESKLDEAVFQVFQQLPVLFGPEVMSFVMNDFAAHHGSWNQVSHALTAALLCHFRSQFVFSGTSESLTKDHLVSLRNSKNFHKFVEKQSDAVQIDLFLDDNYTVEVFLKDRLRLAVYKKTLILGMELASKLLENVGKISIWEIYQWILEKESWRDCHIVQEIALNRELDAIKQAIPECRKMIQQRRSKTFSASDFEEVFETFAAKLAKETTVDPLLAMRARHNAKPLIAELLDELSHIVGDKLASVVFREHHIFSDFQAVKNLLQGRFRSDCDEVLRDPLSLLQDSEDLRTIQTKPDLSLVSQCIKGERRALSFVKSMSSFLHRLDLERQEQDGSEAEEELKEITPEIRARFMTCLPALNALGKLALTEKGRKCFYTIVS